MGRHADKTETQFDLRRSAALAGLTGGAVWVIAFFLADGSGPERAVLVLGAVLLTAALCGLGMRLVRGDVLPLRIFVAVALPTLVWGVFGIVHQSAQDPDLVDAAFGALVGLVSAVRLGHHAAGVPRATL